MSRIQVLPLPTETVGAVTRTPYILVLDETEGHEGGDGARSRAVARQQSEWAAWCDGVQRNVRRGDAVRWERVPPPEPCTSPDGHRSLDFMSPSDSIPIAVRCRFCGRHWQVVVFEEDK